MGVEFEKVESLNMYVDSEWTFMQLPFWLTVGRSQFTQHVFAFTADWVKVG